VDNDTEGVAEADVEVVGGITSPFDVDGAGLDLVKFLNPFLPL
jgi:hypothetical protein